MSNVTTTLSVTGVLLAALACAQGATAQTIHTIRATLRSASVRTTRFPNTFRRPPVNRSAHALVAMSLACSAAFLGNLHASSAQVLYNTLYTGTASKTAWSENAGYITSRYTPDGCSGVMLRPGLYMYKSAWSENLGWINFGNIPLDNAMYTNTVRATAGGPVLDWGVNALYDGVQTSVFPLSGYAWGENVGWIGFGVGPFGAISRSVSASTLPMGLVTTDSNTTIGRWSATVTGHPMPSYGGAAEAIQDTSVGPTALSGTVQASAFDDSQIYGGDATSQFATTFTLASASNCVITGTWHCDRDGSSGGDGAIISDTFVLSSPGGPVYSSGYDSHLSALSGTLAYTGVLPPGTYTLNVSAHANFVHVGMQLNWRTSQLSFNVSIPALSPTAYYSFADKRLHGYAWGENIGWINFDDTNVYTSFYCRADFNQNGIIEVQDIFDFLGAWFAGTLQADVGVQAVCATALSVQDIFDFLSLWFGGC